MTILALHKSKPADDVTSSLRRLADIIESGEIEWPVTTCIVLLAHADAEIPSGDHELGQRSYWKMYGYGPRCDTFTVRGVIATALND